MCGLQVVQAEIESIDSSSEKCIETIDDTIGDVIDMVQARKREMMLAVSRWLMRTPSTRPRCRFSRT